MTYHAHLVSVANRVSDTDNTITTHEGIDVSAYAAINSSAITFTPTSQASDVVYRFTFYINPYQASGPAGRDGRTHFKLQADSGSGFADVAGCEANEVFESAASKPMCQRLMTLKFRLAPSSGSTDYRVVAKSWSSAYRAALHYTHFWSGVARTSGTTSGMKVYYPTVEMYELR